MMLIGLLFFLLLRKRKHATSGGQLKSRDSYSDSSSISFRANSAEYFGVPLFSYAQLKEVTNNFDHAQELGDGGFGTVYYGKLLYRTPHNSLIVWHTACYCIVENLYYAFIGLGQFQHVHGPEL